MRPFPKWLLWTGSAATGVTGAAYWWMDHMMEPVGEWAVINHPLQPWVLKAHIVVAPLLVFAVGMIALDHVWKHFRGRIRRGRRSGLTTMWVVVPMILSGYLIQAVTHIGWLAVVVWLHVLTGIAFVVGLAAHQLAIRATRLGTDRPVPASAGPTGRSRSPQRL